MAVQLLTSETLKTLRTLERNIENGRIECEFSKYPDGHEYLTLSSNNPERLYDNLKSALNNLNITEEYLAKNNMPLNNNNSAFISQASNKIIVDGIALIALSQAISLPENKDIEITSEWKQDKFPDLQGRKFSAQSFNKIEKDYGKFFRPEIIKEDRIALGLESKEEKSGAIDYSDKAQNTYRFDDATKIAIHDALVPISFQHKGSFSTSLSEEGIVVTITNNEVADTYLNALNQIKNSNFLQHINITERNEFEFSVSKEKDTTTINLGKALSDMAARFGMRGDAVEEYAEKHNIQIEEIEELRKSNKVADRDATNEEGLKLLKEKLEQNETDLNVGGEPGTDIEGQTSPKASKKGSSKKKGK